MAGFLIQVSGNAIEAEADPAYIAGAKGPRFCDERFATVSISMRVPTGGARGSADTKPGRPSIPMMRGCSIVQVMLENMGRA